MTVLFYILYPIFVGVSIGLFIRLADRWAYPPEEEDDQLQ